MFEVSKYIGASVPKKDSYGLHVPSMPKQPVLLAFYQYGPNTVLTLHPDARNTIEHTRDDRTLRVKVLRPLKVGYGKKVQTVLVEVEDGRPDLLGEKLVLRCFDTLYVSPDLLEVIPFPSNPCTPCLDNCKAPGKSSVRKGEMGENGKSTETLDHPGTKHGEECSTSVAKTSLLQQV